MSDFSVWQGIYSDFKSANGATDVFLNNVWIDKQCTKISQKLESYKNEDCTSSLYAVRDYPLALWIAAELAISEKLHILDIGGGMGEQYLEILARCPEAKERLSFTILENKFLNESVPKSMAAFKNLHFISELSELQGNVDIVHFGSSMQYVEDWKGFLKTLLSLPGVSSLIMSDFLAGDIPTFVTLQKYGERSIPIRMYNEKEFSSFVENFGLKLSYRTYFDSRVLNSEFLPNSGLPKEYRIPKTINLVFKKRASHG